MASLSSWRWPGSRPIRGRLEVKVLVVASLELRARFYLPFVLEIIAGPKMFSQRTKITSRAFTAP
jgi:hypothetical protein